MATRRSARPLNVALSQSLIKLFLLISSSLPLLVASPILSSPAYSSFVKDGGGGGEGDSDAPDVQPGSGIFWLQLVVVALLVLAGGAFAGLTLGLMGLEILNLRVLSTSGTEREQVQAQKVLKLLERGRHWVLVVLLLSNVVVNECLPIFLDSILGGGVWAIILSTALVVIFGEIIPQSICVRYGLAIGAASAPFVLALMYIEYPIAYPIAMLLDWTLGHDEGTTYRKAELKTFVGLHRHIGTDGLNEDEVTIISAVLDLSSKTIVDIMVPIEDTFTLSTDTVLDEDTVTELVAQGYSRVPVHEAGSEKNFIGMLLVKNLISYDPEDAKKVSEFQLTALPEAAADMTCLEALNFFQQGRSHMLLVSSEPGKAGGALGVVSLEDVIEEMIGEEIVDETDAWVDVAQKIKVIRKPLTSRGPAAKGLAPLIKGVVEKRRSAVAAGDYGAIGGRPNTASPLGGNDDDSGSADTSATVNGQLGGGAFDKVKLKGGEQPPRRPPRTQRTGSRRPTAESTMREPSEGTPLLFQDPANDEVSQSPQGR